MSLFKKLKNTFNCIKTKPLETAARDQKNMSRNAGELVKNALLYPRVSDPLVSSFLKKRSKGSRKALERKLFYKRLNFFQSKRNANAIRAHPKETADYTVPAGISPWIYKLKKDQVYKQYVKDLDENAIIIFIHDISDTLTDLHFKKNIVDEVIKLESGTQTIKIANTINPLLQETIPEAHKSLKSSFEYLEDIRRKFQLQISESDNFRANTKALFIPAHSLEVTIPILNIFDNHPGSYDLFGVYLNLQRSPKLQREFSRMWDIASPLAGETNYQHLMKRAAFSSHPPTATMGELLLTKMGQIGLVKTNLDHNSISFAKTLNKETAL